MHGIGSTDRHCCICIIRVVKVEIVIVAIRMGIYTDTREEMKDRVDLITKVPRIIGGRKK